MEAEQEEGRGKNQVKNFCGQKRLRKVSAKNFTKGLFSRFAKAVREYELVQEGTGLQSVFPVEKIRC